MIVRRDSTFARRIVLILACFLGGFMLVIVASRIYVLEQRQHALEARVATLEQAVEAAR